MNEDEESKLKNSNSVKKKVIKNLKYIFRLKQKKK